MSKLFITNIVTNTLFGKCTQTKKAQSWCHSSDLTSSWKSCKTHTNTKTSFRDANSAMVANKFLLQDFLGISNDAEV